MSLAPVFGQIEYDQNLLPNPIFTPESEEKVKVYFKLAEIAKNKVFWSSLGLLAISGTFLAMVWTSGSTIYHCFQRNQSDPSIFTEISVHICISANGDRVDSFWSFLSGGTFAYLSLFNLFFVIIFYFSTRNTVETSIKLLAYGVKTTCYSVYGIIYYMLGLLIGLLLWQTLHQNLTPLNLLGNESLYFWGYKNYPETFLGNSSRFLQNLGVLIGLIKFMLLSVKDPFEAFCSLSNMMNISSNHHGFQLPVIKYTTEVFPISATNEKRIRQESKKKDKQKEKKKKTKISQEEEDYLFQQTLTAFDEQGLLLPCDEEETQMNICDYIKSYMGLRSGGFEKICRYLINKKKKINNQERKLLKQTLKKLLLNMYTKTTPLFLLFSMAYTGVMLIAELNMQKGIIFTINWSWVYDFPILLIVCHNISTIAMMFLLEFVWVLAFCVLSLAGACFEAYLSATIMLELINSHENYYIIAPYITLIMTIIQIIMHIKILLIIRLIQKGKKLLLEDPNESSDLALPINTDTL